MRKNNPIRVTVTFEMDVSDELFDRLNTGTDIDNQTWALRNCFRNNTRMIVGCDIEALQGVLVWEKIIDNPEEVDA